jgi:hypothetical protein
MFDTLFVYAAIIGGTALAFQFVLMLFGFADDGGDVSADAGDLAGAGDATAAGELDMGGDIAGDHHEAGWSEAGDADLGHPGAHWFYEMLSLRTISAALAFFGLAGKTAQARGLNDTTSLAIGLAAGAGAMYAVYWLFKQVYKVQNAGNENIRLSVGLPAKVYVPIPADRAGKGKVMFRLQDRTVEYQALSDEGERLRTGEEVIITGVVSPDTVCVARAPQPAQAVDG